MSLVQDLLRRRVPQVVVIYMGASWGIVEFVDFITLRFALSPNLVDLALLGPLLLLPSVVLVTYFHGAPGDDQWVTVEKIGIPANLVIAVLFLLFFFQGKDLGAATTTVTVTDEEGVETERVVPKTEFRKRITVHFFDAEPGDTAATWLQYGLPVAVLSDLYQDPFIDLRAPVHFPDRLREAGFGEMVNVPLSLARELAEEQHREHFVTGTVATQNGEIQATVSVYDARRGSLLEEHSFSGTDVLAMADAVSVQLREDLRVPDMGDDAPQDLPAAEILTDSPKAFRLYSDAVKALLVTRDFPTSLSLLEEAVAVDPTFAEAQGTLGSLYMMMNRTGDASAPLQAAMDHLYRLPERSRFLVRSNYYFLVREDVERAWDVLAMWAELMPNDIEAHQYRLTLQILRDDKAGALESLQTVLELDPGQRDVLIQIGMMQEAMGDFEAARATFQEYADEFPENHQVLTRLADLSQTTGDLESAKNYYNRALLLEPSDVGLTVGMASVERSLGNFDDAVSLLEDAEAMAETPQEQAQVLSAFASHHSFLGQINAQIEYVEQRRALAATFTPGLAVTQEIVFQAAIYAQAGRAEDALAMVSQARSQLSPPYDGVVSLGELDVYRVLEDADGIEATLPGAENFIVGMNAEIHRPRLSHARGRMHELRGEYQEAIEQYEEQRRLDPADTSIPVRLARCYRELGDVGQSASLLEESLRVSPYDPYRNYEMALTYEALGRMDDARTHLGRALEIWADADPEYKWAGRAREAAERIGV